ncbi:MAG TPA: Rieske (2Fe-2S) protein [Cellvibrio sp.]|nr:Rieske (2Fe-2S) protein [Cellvibrio sp.]
MANPTPKLRLCALAEIPEAGSKGFLIAGRKLFAVRQAGKTYLYHNQCPHLGIPLEWVEDQFLDSSGSMIQCANHGALFVIKTGKCVAGPCSGRSLVPIDFIIEAGDIFIFPS